MEQRVAALERDNIVLHDTVKLLHKMLKDQRQLIHEYIVLKLGSANANDNLNSCNARPEDALYTFVCKQRLDRIDRQIEKVHKFIKDLKTDLNFSKEEAA
jgi:hypothetical protein